MSEWSVVSTWGASKHHNGIKECLSGASCQPEGSVVSTWGASKHHNNPTKLVSLVQGGHHHHLIECNLFLPWYSWKFNHLVFNSKHMVTQLSSTLLGIHVHSNLYLKGTQGNPKICLFWAVALHIQVKIICTIY